MTNRVLLQPAYVLHQRPYRDTSALVEILTPQYGRVGLVARGARRPSSNLRGLLQPFVPLLISWSGRGDLATLTAAEAQGRAIRLQQQCLASGLYLNELLMRLLQRYEAQVELFSVYDQTLRALQGIELQSASGALERRLRIFEMQLLQSLGYGLLLDKEAKTGRTIDPQQTYEYQIEVGPVVHEPQSDQPLYGVLVSGATLLAMADHNTFCDSAAGAALKQAKQLMRFVLNRYLGPKPLMSRQLLGGKNTMNGVQQSGKKHKEQTSQ